MLLVTTKYIDFNSEVSQIGLPIQLYVRLRYSA